MENTFSFVCSVHQNRGGLCEVRGGTDCRVCSESRLLVPVSHQANKTLHPSKVTDLALILSGKDNTLSFPSGDHRKSLHRPKTHSNGLHDIP